jgi:hypothetical protein
MTTEHRLLAEDLLLLAWDDEAGKPRSSASVQLPTAIGGALLLDLALRDRLRIEVDVPRASGRRTGDDLLDEVASQLRDGPSRRKLKSWVRKIGTSARRDQVHDRLVARGLLVPEERKVLGLFPVTRHRLGEPAQLERLAGEVRSVLEGARPADDRITALVALVGATAVLDQLVARAERRAARERAKALAESSPVAAAARAVIRETQAAVIASITAAAGAASNS